MKKLDNFWFYYRKYVGIGMALILVLGYLGLSDRGPEPDYHVGIVCRKQLHQEVLEALQDRITDAGEDLNGDGEVVVQVHTYYVDLQDSASDADTDRIQVISALDADLVGCVSGLFLLDDPEAFRQSAPGILGPAEAEFSEGLILAVRVDAAGSYQTLADKLS